MPSANTTPWQLESVIKGLLKNNFNNLVAVENKTVVTRPKHGEKLNKYDTIYKKYKIPVKFNFLNTDMRWIKYEPKSEMNVLHKIYPKGTQNFMKVDAHFLPFKDRSFDVALSFNVLEHLQNPLKALNEMKRVAREVRIRVPVREFNRYIVEGLGLLHTFLAIPFLKTVKHFERHLKSVMKWSDRTKTHLWIIRLKNYDQKIVRRKYFLPNEIDYVFKG